jgi:hypothetical protein
LAALSLQVASGKAPARFRLVDAEHEQMSASDGPTDRATLIVVALSLEMFWLATMFVRRPMFCAGTSGPRGRAVATGPGCGRVGAENFLPARDLAQAVLRAGRGQAAYRLMRGLRVVNLEGSRRAG